MTDISKCMGAGIENEGGSLGICPPRQRCYRYTAQHGQWQSYIVAPYNLETNSCELFWENENGKEEGC